jgi:hypothetical protein
LKGVGVQFCVDVSATCVFLFFFWRGSEGNELFVGETIFEKKIKVQGCTYVY